MVIVRVKWDNMGTNTRYTAKFYLNINYDFSSTSYNIIFKIFTKISYKIVALTSCLTNLLKFTWKEQ